MRKTIVIGIAGASGSGKSTFCSTITQNLKNVKTICISTDGYFKKVLPKMRSPLTGREYDDWNSPNSIDSTQLIMDVIQQTETLNEGVVFVEGLSVLYFEQLRDLFNLKIYIDLDSDERMFRRIKRNMKMWGASMEEVGDYFLESAKYNEQKYFIPTKVYADIVLLGNTFKGVAIDVLISWINSQMSGG